MKIQVHRSILRHFASIMKIFTEIILIYINHNFKICLFVFLIACTFLQLQPKQMDVGQLRLLNYVVSINCFCDLCQSKLEILKQTRIKEV